MVSNSVQTLFQSTYKTTSEVALHRLYLSYQTSSSKPSVKIYYEDIHSVFLKRYFGFKFTLMIVMLTTNFLFLYLIGVLSLGHGFLTLSVFALLILLFMLRRPFAVGVKMKEEPHLIFFTENKREAHLLVNTLNNQRRQIVE